MCVYMYIYICTLYEAFRFPGSTVDLGGSPQCVHVLWQEKALTSHIMTTKALAKHAHQTTLGSQ